jgi:hypothetical protein
MRRAGTVKASVGTLSTAPAAYAFIESVPLGFVNKWAGFSA